MTKKSTLLYLALCIGIFTACKTTQPLAKVKPNDSQVAQRKLNDIALNGKVYASLWQQNAGEFRALCYQAYSIAQNNIDKMTTPISDKPYAIITDVDETFLDNSPYAVTQALKGNEFDYATWLEWTSKGEAIAYPGSLDFFTYAASKNVTIFYVTNRNEKDKAGTLKNLQQLHFPFADDQHLLVLTTTSNKEERRKEILKKYNVIMYLGDNLTDFSDVFYKKSQTDRNHNVDSLSREFGTKFIVLPNSGYGDWESALPGYNYKLSPTQKDSVILLNLKKY